MNTVFILNNLSSSEPRYSNRRINDRPDFVLAFKDYSFKDKNDDEQKRRNFVKALKEHAIKDKHQDDEQKRSNFEKDLRKVGLDLQMESYKKVHFVKIYAPQHVLSQYAEILKLRFPMKDGEEYEAPPSMLKSLVLKFFKWCNISFDINSIATKKCKLAAEYSRDKIYLFDENDPDYFNDSSKITIVSYILERAEYGQDPNEKGIKRLLSEGVYVAAYPLHDGNIKDIGTKRQILGDDWASVNKFYKFQPLDEIKDYLGVKYALYFTWLGYYTYMLIPASLMGIFCLIYAAATVSDDNFSRDICNSEIIMCPKCDKHCDYWKLKDICAYSKIQHFIDNPATIFFTIFMSLWATLFLELWKRYSSEMAHKWGLIGFDLQAEPPRPEYLIKLTNEKKVLNVVTRTEEPVAPFWKKIPTIILSFGMVLLWIFAALAVVLGVVIYRMSLAASDSLYHTTALSTYIVIITAALINLVGIFILNFTYEKLAVWLTDMEFQRTQTQYEDSLTLKIYLFQCVNFYSSIFYIAFLKGQFVGYPGKYNKIFGFRQEECAPGGCLMELTIQLAIIMIGKQTANAVMENSMPILKNMYKTFKVKTGYQNACSDDEQFSLWNQLTEDYKLSEASSLFEEYMEMVIQYGFVTIFVTAFPLAPLFALLNNVFEMRLDAKKLIKYFRRPVPQRVKDIGVWYLIMEVIGRVSVASNAFIIAFCSHFIPRLVYSYNINQNHTDDGFLNFTLAYFNTSDFEPGTAPIKSEYNVSICRYSEYRNPPWHQEKYKRPLIYWHILAGRLAFIVVYQNLLNFITTAVEWAVPDISRDLSDQIKREAYKTNETIIKHEIYKAQENKQD